MTSTTIAREAKNAFDAFQSTEQTYKNQALRTLKQALVENKHEILQANDVDVQEAEALVREGKLSESIVKRLNLRSSPDKFDSIVDGIEGVIKLDDPTGKIHSVTKLDEQLDLYKVSCPIGVLLIIFEARPEVLINIAALAIKSGNAAILKGGKESIKTQDVLTRIIKQALSSCLPANLIQTISSRSDVNELLQQNQYIDLVIPRGSKELVQFIQDHTKIPVLGHADGLCNIYIDQDADAEKVIRCVLDAKTTYPAACNSVETLLVHRSWLGKEFTELVVNLLNEKVTLKLDQASLDALKSSPVVTNHLLFWSNCSLAREEDFKTEWLSLTLSIKTVDSITEAISHINQYSSHHTDSIITESLSHGTQFCRAVNSASVYVNCSTRFADGYRYGFGTEIGISTSKIHSRGPVGLDGLVIYKWMMFGTGSRAHITADYAPDKKQFLHFPVPLDEPGLMNPFSSD
ncbi:glutamate-5-semialdehyde dehydrogenase [Puccinia sorghi]|uniref:glutamate-5-semialdehyde dehydrogenase n=1 Tax=Puccinia sorghi TaxID=27349 RepID=A0A0L6VNP0_9BASI|nr:glutamate-5-semialdehyde dehydrogenase [Puccinia sorghi]